MTNKLKSIIRDRYSYDWTKQDNELITDPYITIPNDAYSIQEILERFSKGLPIAEKDAIWSNTDDYEDVIPEHDPMFDLSDVSEAQAFI